MKPICEIREVRLRPRESRCDFVHYCTYSRTAGEACALRVGVGELKDQQLSHKRGGRETGPGFVGFSASRLAIPRLAAGWWTP